MGINCIQYTTDMILIQELIFKIQPDFIIETGTNVGGSALFYASMMEIMGKGKVITVDKDDKIDCNSEGYKTKAGKRVINITGRSTEKYVLDQINFHVPINSRSIVILDSLHSKNNVFQELKLYNKFVKKGDYLIVQDSDLNGHPVWKDYGPGPHEAITEFLKINDDFQPDRELEERFFLTCSPNGYLKRIK